MEKINWGWIIIYIDAEFNETQEEKVNPVCAVAYNDTTGTVTKFWSFENPQTQAKFKKYCEENKDEVWVSFAVTAEARYFISHALDPVVYRWIDLFIEYKLISNHNDRIAYGEQLVNGKIKYTKRPPAKWQRSEEDSASSYRQTYSLTEATYKLCGVVRDSAHKDLMRDIIISNDRVKILENKDAILQYCYEDTIYLKNIYQAILREFQELLDIDELMRLNSAMLLRGKYSALTARMESYGYPINYEATKNFSGSIKSILNDCQSEINELFPEISPFRWNAKNFNYTWNQGVTKEWIRKNVPDVERWMQTDKGDISLSLEAWTRFFDYKHDYPKDNFGAQMVRYLKLKQNLNGFTDANGKDRRTFWDSVGSDQRVRPYMNHYGAQSSRSQPAATGFLFLKPAWMRSLCQPKKGKAIGGFDYGSQEFLISALVSADENMLWAYESGDVYLALAKLAGAVPMNGTKDDYKKERDLFKATTLGISYLMTKVGLAAKLTADTGKKVTEDEAQELIDLFYASYPDFAKWQKDAIENYMKRKQKVVLPCDWMMFTDNDNFRSAVNCPIQGCIDGDSLVYTKEFGPKKISDISGKSNIQVWDGEKFVLANCVESGKKLKVIVTLYNGQEIVCSPEHKFLTVSNDGRKEVWKTPEQFGIQEFIKLSEELEDYFTPAVYIETPISRAHNASKTSFKDFPITEFEMGLILGRLASDGVVRQGKDLKWIFAEHELDSRDCILDILKKCPVKIRERIRDREDRNQKVYEYMIDSAKLSKEMASLKKDLSSCSYILSSKQRVIGFLKGYADGDGTVNSDNLVISFGKGENKKKNAIWIQKMFGILGIRTRINYYEGLRTNLLVLKSDIPKFVRMVGVIKKEKNDKLKKISPSRSENPAIGRVERVMSVKVTDELIPMFDIADCPNQRFAFDGVVSHNTGASAMRKAVEFCYEAGLNVIFTLHDAIYIEFDSDDVTAMDKLHDCMFRGFIHYFEDKKAAGLIRLDGKVWSPDYTSDNIMLESYTKKNKKTGKDETFYELVTAQGKKISASEIHIDERALGEYQQFKKYFEPSGDDLL